MKRKFPLALAIMVALIFVPTHVMGNQFFVQTSETQPEEVEVMPLVQTFTYNADNFELNVTVPSYISLSTPDDKRPARLNVYLKIAKALSGLFRVDIEAGIGISFPTFSLYAFSDTDVTWLGKSYPDRIRLIWPISGVPIEVISLESGDVGVYALAVPIKMAEVELESLSVGEWSHIGSYDIYVVGEQKLVALGIPTEDVIIGEVTSLEPEADCTALEHKYNELKAKHDEVLAEYHSLETSYTTLKTDYVDLKAKHDKLTSDYDKLKTSYDGLKGDYDLLKSDCDGLRSEHESTTKQLEIKIRELNTTTHLMYIFIITTIAFVATTVYFAKRKSKTT